MTDGGVDLSRTLVILQEGAEATLLAEAASTASNNVGMIRCMRRALISRGKMRNRSACGQHKSPSTGVNMLQAADAYGLFRKWLSDYDLGAGAAQNSGRRRIESYGH